LFDAVRPA
jgi:hypothetical protein